MTKFKKIVSGTLAGCLMASALMMSAGAANVQTYIPSGTVQAAAQNTAQTRTAVKINPQSADIYAEGIPAAFPSEDGKTVYTALSYNGSTYMPLRTVGRWMGKNISWDGASRTVFLSGTTEKSYPCAVFRTDEEYDRAGLPLPIELSVSFSAVGAPAPADAELADYLLKTKAVCEETGQPFAYYSVALAFKPTEQEDPVWWAAEHIPSEEITEEKILDYLAALDCGVKANCGQSLNGRNEIIEERKNAWLISHGYEHCAH